MDRIPERPLQPSHDVGSLYDAADEDDGYDRHRQDELDREQMLEQALDEAAAKGVCKENLITLAREAGAVRWALEKSLRSD